MCGLQQESITQPLYVFLSTLYLQCALCAIRIDSNAVFSTKTVKSMHYAIRVECSTVID